MTKLLFPRLHLRLPTHSYLPRHAQPPRRTHTRFRRTRARGHRPGSGPHSYEPRPRLRLRPSSLSARVSAGAIEEVRAKNNNTDHDSQCAGLRLELERDGSLHNLWQAPRQCTLTKQSDACRARPAATHGPPVTSSTTTCYNPDTEPAQKRQQSQKSRYLFVGESHKVWGRLVFSQILSRTNPSRRGEAIARRTAVCVIGRQCR